jgi:hypothetical protein
VEVDFFLRMLAMQNWMKKTFFVTFLGWTLVGSSIASAYMYFPHGQNVQGTYFRRVTRTTTVTPIFAFPSYGQSAACGWGGACGGGGWNNGCGGGAWGGSCGGGQWNGGWGGGWGGACGGGWGGACGGGWGGQQWAAPRSNWGHVAVGPISVGWANTRFY